MCKLLACLLVTVGSAGALTFSGGGISGTILPGTTAWVVDADGSSSWSIPGVNDGTVPLQGQDTFFDFHITFSDLPQGVVLTSTFSGACSSNMQNVFCDNTTGVIWNGVLDGPNAISFYAPTGDPGLQPGQTFYTNIFFTGDPSDALKFQGSWTQGGVPEPSTLILAGLGAGALGLWRRRKR